MRGSCKPGNILCSGLAGVLLTAGMLLATGLSTPTASPSTPPRLDGRPTATIASTQGIGGRAREEFWTTDFRDVAHTTAGWGYGRLSFPDEMEYRSSFDVGAAARCLVVDGMRAYVGTASDVRIIDAVTTPPTLFGTFPIVRYGAVDKSVRGIAVQDGIGFFAAGDAGFQIADVSKAGDIQLIGDGTAWDFGKVLDVAVGGHYAYVVDDRNGLSILDVTDPRAPLLMSRGYVNGAKHVVVSVDLACVAATDSLIVFSVTDRSWPQRIAAVPLSADGRIVMTGDRLYAAEDHILRVVDLSYPYAPTVADAASFAAGPDLAHSGIDGDYLFATMTVAGCYAIDLSDPDRAGIVNRVYGGSPPLWVAASRWLVFTMGKNISPLVVRTHPFDGLRDRNVAQSLPIALTERDITRVRIMPEQHGNIAWEISADGGAHWQPITPGAAWSDVEYPGTALLWRARLTPSDLELSECTELVVDWRHANRAWTVLASGTGEATSIREGVDMSVAGDTLLLGPGVFSGPDNRAVSVMHDLVVRGTGSGMTAIDCEDAGGAFFVGNAESARDRDMLDFDIQGVTIRNVGVTACGAICANAAHVSAADCVFTTGTAAAIRVSLGYARVRDSKVEYCKTGVVVLDGDAPTEVTQCEISNVWNGLEVLNARATVAGCAFGGTLESVILGDHANMTITGCEFVNDNRANRDPSAGVISLRRQSMCDISGNRFYDNTGTLFMLSEMSGATSTIQGNVVVRNRGALLSAANLSGIAVLLSNTVVGNIAGDKALVIMQSAKVGLNRNIFAYNAARGVVSGAGFVVYNLYNDYFYNGGILPPAPDDKDGNFSADPWFCNSFADDYALQDGSACLAANNASGELVGALGAGCVAVRPLVDVSPQVHDEGDNPGVIVTLLPDRATGGLDVDPATARLGGVLFASTEPGPKRGLTLRFNMRTIAGLLQPVGDTELRRVYLTAQTTGGRPLRTPIDFRYPHAAVAESADSTRTGGARGPVRIITGIASVTPNPFNPVTTIRFGVASPGTVDLTVFDVTGRVVERVLHRAMPAGEHAVTWEAEGVASGVYFARLTTPDGTWTRKLVVTR